VAAWSKELRSIPDPDDVKEPDNALDNNEFSDDTELI